MPIPRITREDLKARLDASADAVVIVDVRLKYPFEHSSVMLPGAIRIDPKNPDLARIPPGHEVVAYDSDPDELVSAPFVAMLRERGIRAWALEGGIGEWMAANLPTVPKEAPRAAAPAAGALKD
jgi:rhodanese-related sulfurtransferase